MATHDEFFARVVHGRRKQELGLSMEQVASRRGPSVPTQVVAEGARLGEHVQGGTFTKYDTALGWVPGSARAAYREGRQPIPIAGDYQSLEPGAAAVSVALEELLPLLEAQRELHTATVADLAVAVEQLDGAISGLVGPFVTDLLERNRGQTLNPLIEIAFGEMLAAPVPADDPRRAERLYRRWLVGRADDLDESTVQEFEERYQSRTQARR